MHHEFSEMLLSSGLFVWKEGVRISRCLNEINFDLDPKKQKFWVLDSGYKTFTSKNNNCRCAGGSPRTNIRVGWNYHTEKGLT